MLEKKFKKKCDTLFVEYKSKIYKNTNLSEKNDKISFDYFPFFNDTFENFQFDLSEKLISFH
jgi:hypothetical protein